MNILFYLSLNLSSRSSYIYYSIFISDNAEEKKNIKAEKDCQHVSSSVEEKIEKNNFMCKIIISSVLNNSRKLKKENSESSENCISSLSFKIFNSAESILKATSKCLYNSKSLSSKSDKQTRSIKKFKNRFNYKDFHREHLIKFEKKAHMYSVFKALFINDHMIFLNIKVLSLSMSTKF